MVTRLIAVLALTCAAGLAEAQQPVSWTNSHNVVVRGGSLEKNAGCNGCDDAGAISRQVIRSGNGFAEFTVGEDYSFYMAGLSRQSDTTRFGNIDFGIRVNGNGWADVVENGNYVGGDTDYRAGDRFRIEVGNGEIRYFKNSQLMYVSQRRATYPLVLNVSLGSTNSTIRNARIDTRDRAVATSGSYDDFDQMDRNNDGVITRREWRGIGRDFNRQDLNRDGVISRYEYDGSNQAAAGTSGQFVVVNGNEPWVNTGIYLRAGESVNLQADGSIQMSTDRNDFAGPAGSRRRANNAPLWQTSAGTLIARVGNSAPFVVGASRTVRAPASGQLFLGINDDYFPDNSGQYRVTVTVEP